MSDQMLQFLASGRAWRLWPQVLLVGAGIYFCFAAFDEPYWSFNYEVRKAFRLQEIEGSASLLLGVILLCLGGLWLAQKLAQQVIDNRNSHA